MGEVGLLSPDDRVELIDGELVEMPPIGDRHSSAVDLLAKGFIRSVGDAAHVRIQGPVRLGVHSETQPDIALLKPRADFYKSRSPTASDVLLVIEVSESTLRYDLETKARLYARHGIAQYCVLDLVDSQLHRFRRPRGGQYAERETVSTGTVSFAPVDAEIDIDDLF